ncbi:hypothetical protein LZP69_01120 [Shewanella sp. AS1]|uniref:hypothetical protein n=1 Tax=Shewanella sp. AS1 TaxID=2907626 RepID=UPI001F1B639E|nr:hypothetical protein [Shewanella sp. AS1]MCE9677792.1 hypothetical protein [Shewanella sp. AS1]
MTIISAVLFGSQVSGGSDQQSDKDLLVVCKPKYKIDAIEKYSDLGYSVSVYTLRQLENMRLQGSLFLQHLKNESRVLYDSNGVFAQFIAQCQFVSPSLEEMKRSTKSLVNALNCPVDYRISWWLADYLFVLSRDYFIKHFAKKGLVIFNVIQLSQAIEKEFKLKRAEAEVFLKLRKCKSIYRSGRFEGELVGKVLSAWYDILTKILAEKPVIRLTAKAYLCGRAIDNFESSYELLRYVESLRIMFPDVKCGTESEHHVMKMIRNPNHYSSTSAKGKQFLASYLAEFRKEANKCANSNSQKWRYCCHATFTADYA